LNKKKESVKPMRIIYEKVGKNEFHELLKLPNGEKKPFQWIGSWIAYYDVDGQRKIYEMSKEELQEVYESIKALPKGSTIISGSQ